MTWFIVTSLLICFILALGKRVGRDRRRRQHSIRSTMSSHLLVCFATSFAQQSITCAKSTTVVVFCRLLRIKID